MAVIHDTTMTPGKLELLAAWLPAQPWYRDRGREPELTRAGGAQSVSHTPDPTVVVEPVLDGTRVRGVLATARAETP
jgi:Maltokinase N-terminal cap domain